MAEMSKSGKAGLMLAGGATLAAAIALYQSTKARAAPAGQNGQGALMLDEATMELLVAMAQNGADIAQLIQEILNAGQNGDSVPLIQGYPANADSIEALGIPITALDAAVQLPDMPVPDGMALLLKGFPRNNQIVFVAKSASAATNINQAYPLIPNENVRYYVKNASAIYFAGITGFSAVNDILTITVEVRKGGG